MRKYIVLYCFTLLQISEDVSGGLFGKRVVRIDMLRECEDYPGYQDLPMRYVNISLLSDATRKTLINSTLVVSKNITQTLSASAKLTRCKNRESPDTCDLFTTLKLPNFLAAVNIKGQFWSPLTNHYQPPIKSTLSTGVYKITNGYFDADATPFPVPERTYWKCRVEAFAKKTLVNCFYLEGCMTKMKQD